MTEQANDEYAICRKRARACAELIFPHCDVTESPDNGGSVCAFTVTFGGNRASFGFEIDPKRFLGGTNANAELLKQLTDAADRYARSNRGKVQPYVHGVDPGEPWPELKPASEPPSDERRVIVVGEFTRGYPALWDGQWVEVRDGGAPLRNDWIVTHWRELSAYELATMPKEH